MSYSAEISRSNPTCFVFLIDQSGSMQDPFGGEAVGSKGDFVADVVNRTLHDLVIRCTKTEEIRNYYHVAVLGYGGETVQPALLGELAGRELVPIAELADKPARIETRNKKVPDGAGGLVEQQVRFPIWLESTAGGGTPMCAALALCQRLVEQWVAEHRNSFPPTILHLTDGASSDGDPSPIAQQITALKTGDGNALLYTCHVSSTRGAKVEYPQAEANLPDDFAKGLFRMSSALPEPFVRAAAQVGIAAGEGSRGFVFNGDAASVVQFFDIGTRPANLR
jgi:hypothetical protein